MGDLAEPSAGGVDRTKRFIAARSGRVEFAPLKEERRAVG
jgi:hypothetical protein